MNEEFHLWKEHFINQAKGLIPQEIFFYNVSTQKGRGEPSANIKMVSPTEQIVKRAKATLSQVPTSPPTVYDPVTGVIQAEQRKTQTKLPSRKRKNTNTKKKKYKKRKISVKKKRKTKKRSQQKGKGKGKKRIKKSQKKKNGMVNKYIYKYS